LIVGYARVSTLDQSTKVQIATFEKNGITRIFEEKKSAVKSRPVLENLIANVLRPGDVLAVYKIDRLARSMSHFVRIFESLKARNIGFKSLTESIETVTPQGRMFLQLLGVFAEFERELIRERCLAGQVAARLRGQTWGPKRLFTNRESKQLTEIWRGGWAEQAQLAEMFGCSVSTVRDQIHMIEKRGRWRSLASKK
jgi:DNA invertase Pin-like site-specific DNA recombinase